MNNPSPLVPQGSLNSQGKKRLTLPVAVSMILSLHLLFLAVLLMQGCNRNKDKKTDDTTLGSTDTNTTSSTFPPYTNTTYGATGLSNTAPPMNGFTNPGVGSTIAGTPASGTGSATGTTTDVKPLDASASFDTKEYVVAKGDTLGKIARGHGVTLGALRKANPDAKPTNLKVGQKLKIPAGGSAAADGSSVSSAGPVSGGVTEGSGASSYTVKPGDTLTKIAKAHGTTAKKIRAHNKLTTDKIRVGQKLKIPSGGGAVKEASAKPVDAAAPVDANPNASPAAGTNALR